MTSISHRSLPWHQAPLADREDIISCLELLPNSFPVDSKFAVAAVLYAESGEKFFGVNFEDGAGTAICAERAALVAAITAGHNRIKRVVVAGLFPHEPPSHSVECPPCGHCRQAFLTIANAAGPASNIEFVYFDPSRLMVHFSDIRSLLPMAFSGGHSHMLEWKRSVTSSLRELIDFLRQQR